MRLLWEENLLDAIGAVVVAAFALGAAWLLLEGLVELHGWLAVPLAIAAAVGVLEAISRRHYAGDQRLAHARERSVRFQ